MHNTYTCTHVQTELQECMHVHTVSLVYNFVFVFGSFEHQAGWAIWNTLYIQLHVQEHRLHYLCPSTYVQWLNEWI